MKFQEEYINIGSIRPPLYKNPSRNEVKELLPSNGKSANIGIVSPNEIYMWEMDALNPDKYSHSNVEQAYESGGLKFNVWLEAHVNFDNSVTVQVPMDENLTPPRIKAFNDSKEALKSILGEFKEVVFSENKKYGMVKYLSEMLKKERHAL